MVGPLHEYLFSCKASSALKMLGPVVQFMTVSLGGLFDMQL